jgi:hypothetical protein
MESGLFRLLAHSDLQGHPVYPPWLVLLMLAGTPPMPRNHMPSIVRAASRNESPTG